MKIKNSITIVIVLAMIFMCGLPVQGFAGDEMKAKDTGKIAISVDTGTAGVHVSIYKVASVDADGEIILDGVFEEYDILMDGDSSGDAQAAARALEAYVMRDDVQSTAAKHTGDSDKVTFTGLDPGMYLVSCKHFNSDEGIMVFSPIMADMPAYLDGIRVHHHTVNMKGTCLSGVTECTAYKVWETGSSGITVPEQVVVQLLKDGDVYDEQILNENNSWRYTWKDLDEEHLWTTIEKEVPDGYKVSLEVEGDAFKIKNTASVPEKPGDPGEPGVPEEDVPSEPADEDGDDEDSKEEKLPQTGQLWWPVSVLFVAGMILILAGAYIRRTVRQEQE